MLPIPGENISLLVNRSTVIYKTDGHTGYSNGCCFSYANHNFRLFGPSLLLMKRPNVCLA